MLNPYKQIKAIVRKHSIDSDAVVHALMATVYSTCCNSCAIALRSEEFMNTLDHMTADLVLCGELSKRNIA